MLSLDEARARLLAAAAPLERTERVATLEALGRVLAEPLRSTVDVPPMNNAEMDGYAVRREDLLRVPATLPVAQRVAAGQVGEPLAPGTVARIFTGAAVPAGCDAVVMQERAEAGDGVVTFVETPPAGQFIRRAGFDIAAGAEVLPAGLRLRAQDLGLAASVGCAELPVRPRLRVAVFFTGDELAMPGEALAPGRIYNSNRFVLRGLLQAMGCEIVDLGIVPDRREATREAFVRAAGQADLIVTSGGVSVGEEDHVRPAVEAEGRLELWQVAMKPGKPLAFGAVRGVPFIGLPGNPVSGFVTFQVLVRPFIRRRQGIAAADAPARSMRADFDWTKPDRRREFLRVRINDRGGLDLYRTQNAAVLTSVAWADGLVENPEGKAIVSGDLVAFHPFDAWQG